MIISEFVYNIFKDYNEAGPLSDHLQDKHYAHPELNLYLKRLAKPERLTIQTLVDIVIKFGEPRERREMARIQRMAIRAAKSWRLRNIGWSRPIKWLDNRQAFNRQVQIGDTRTRKEAILACAKKICHRRSGWWYVRMIKSLLTTLFVEEQSLSKKLLNDMLKRDNFLFPHQKELIEAALKHGTTQQG